MQGHDREMFDKCIKAQMQHDNARAAMYANESAELRKMAKITLHSQLALEQVALRLETIREFGDVAAMMAPVASVVRAIHKQIAGVIPEVGFELGEIGEMLNGMVMEAGEATGTGYDFEASNEEAQKILTEAGAIAEQRMKERFPELPTASVATTERTGAQGLTR
jgi:division protein CdvB (Snf7/Vps24/ESCRT-III family)